MNQDHLEDIALSPEKKDIDPLERYIGEGIALIREEKFKEAEKHFRNADKAEEFGFWAGLEETRNIDSLRTEEDLIRSVLSLAKLFRSSEKGTWIAFPVYVDRGGFFEPEPFTDPDFYKPELVRNFHHEMAIFCAEEWLHCLQAKKGGPIAGQENDEVDTAAYLYEQGVLLSTIFLTRYLERTDWYLGLHPERTEELLAFQEKWGSSLG